MSNEAKFFFVMCWIYSLLGSALFFHDFGYEDGRRYERSIHDCGYNFNKTVKAFK